MEKAIYDSTKKTPFVAHFDHLSSEDYKKAYEPSEDTFLLIDSLYYDEAFINAIQPKTCLEIGVGCGFVITALCSLVSPSFPECQFIGTDINPDAIKIAQKTVDRYGFSDKIKLLCGDLASTLTEKVDVLVFNPPYVVTSEEEYKEAQEKGDISASWAGGESGTELVERVVKNLRNILSEKGVCYLLLEQKNAPKKIKKEVATIGMECTLIAERNISGEILMIYRIR